MQVQRSHCMVGAVGIVDEDTVKPEVNRSGAGLVGNWAKSLIRKKWIRARF